LAGQGTAVYFQSQQNGAVGVGGEYEYWSGDASAEAVADDDFDLFLVRVLVGVLFD
jgi:hypothetical protein